MRLRDRVAIVTGGGRGIGEAISLALAREGAAVVVNYSCSAAHADEVVKNIHAAGGRAVAVRADVRELGEHQRLVSAAIENFGAVHILVNNAGIEIHEAFLNASTDTWDLILGVNPGALFSQPEGGAGNDPMRRRKDHQYLQRPRR